MEKITVKATVKASKRKAWDYYTLPEHITQWNFADPSWHCPSATNDLRVGGRYVARMEARDGSFGFDFDATYTAVSAYDRLIYEFWGRQAIITFNEHDGQTDISVSFDPEQENPLELQRDGWQSILNNFVKYTEAN